MFALLPMVLLLAAGPIAVALHGGLLAFVGNNPTLAANLIAAFIIYLGSRPSARELLAAIAGAAVLRILYVTLYAPVGIYPGSWIWNWGSFLGLSAIIVLGVRAVEESATQRRRIEDFAAAALCLDGWIILVYVMAATTRDLPRTIDGVLYSFDAGLGFSPSFVLGSVLANRPLLATITHIQYESLFIAVIAVYVWRRNHGSHRNMLAAIVCMLVLGPLLYFVCPATGPVWAFPGAYPRIPPHVSLDLLGPLRVAAGPRNGMPSIHIGLALLAWWGSRGLGRLARMTVGAFLVGTVFSTMALGEHYFVDIVVAVPFAVAIQSITETRAPLVSLHRGAALLCGAVLTAAWMFSFKLGLDFLSWPAAVLWALVIVTAGIPLLLEARLAAQLAMDRPVSAAWRDMAKQST